MSSTNVKNNEYQKCKDNDKLLLMKVVNDTIEFL